MQAEMARSVIIALCVLIGFAASAIIALGLKCRGKDRYCKLLEALLRCDQQTIMEQQDTIARMLARLRKYGVPTKANPVPAEPERDRVRDVQGEV